jgi:two-component sensor histidine kinase
MDAGKWVRDFVEPIVVCSEFSTLEQVADTLHQGKPVAFYWPVWQLLLPENVIGYPFSRRVIDLPLKKALLVPADLPIEEALAKLVGKGSRYALVEEDSRLLGVIAVERLRTHIEGSTRDRALEELKVALRDRKLFLKEAHHRIKNNLQIIASLLSLQASYIKDPDICEMFSESQERVRSMALIHEMLYQSDRMGEIDFAAYVWGLSDQLIHSYGIQASRVTLQLHLDNLWLDVNKAVPCGLILNELISNAFKHAFPDGREGSISVEVSSAEPPLQVTIVVRDDGIGMPVDLDLANAQTLGLQLVYTLIEQLDGRLECDRHEGTKFTLTFPG